MCIVLLSECVSWKVWLQHVEIGSLGGDYIMRAELISALVRETPENSLPLLPCEDSAKRWPSMNQQVGAHQSESAGALILYFSTRTVRNIFLLFIAAQTD